jgi:hypothetical protein
LLDQYRHLSLFLTKNNWDVLVPTLREHEREKWEGSSFWPNSIASQLTSALSMLGHVQLSAQRSVNPTCSCPKEQEELEGSHSFSIFECDEPHGFRHIVSAESQDSALTQEGTFAHRTHHDSSLRVWLSVREDSTTTNTFGGMLTPTVLLSLFLTSNTNVSRSRMVVNTIPAGEIFYEPMGVFFNLHSCIHSQT